MARRGLLAAHGELWYREGGYRLAWLLLPQAIALLVAASILTGGGILPGKLGGDWAEPLNSQAHTRRMEALREKAGVDGDKGALTELQSLSDSGDPQASLKLAQLYDPMYGSTYAAGGLRDAGKAIELYEKGAKAEAAWSEVLRTGIYLNAELGVYDGKKGCELGTRNFAEFKRLYTTPGQGWYFAMLGDCFQGAMRGAEIPVSQITPEGFRNSAEAFQRAVELGWPNVAKTQSALGHIYQYGNAGVKKDPLRAKAYYDACAEQNLGFCLRQLGFMYLNGEGVVQNDETARRYLERGTGAKDAESQSWLGTFYLDGKGGLTRDSRRGVDLLTQAVEQGSRSAPRILGHFYAFGDAMVPRDSAKSVNLFLSAVDSKDPQVDDVVRSNAKNIRDPLFWRLLQEGLRARGAYRGPIDGRANDAIFDAIRTLAG